MSLFYFPSRFCMKTLLRKQLEGRRAYFSPGFQVPIITSVTSQEAGREALVESTVKERKLNARPLFSSHFLLSYPVQNPKPGNDITHSGLGFPISAKAIKISNIPQVN